MPRLQEKVQPSPAGGTTEMDTEPTTTTKPSEAHTTESDAALPPFPKEQEVSMPTARNIFLNYSDDLTFQDEWDILRYCEMY